MKVAVAFIGVFLLTTTTLVAQQGKAPPGCIPCPSLCDWCIAKGLQKGGTAQCYAGCRWWAAKVGQKTIFVRRDASVCGPDYGPARCN